VVYNAFMEQTLALVVELEALGLKVLDVVDLLHGTHTIVLEDGVTVLISPPHLEMEPMVQLHELTYFTDGSGTDVGKQAIAIVNQVEAIKLA